ncbi:hypothetical protein Dalk_2617 [Desulfatibacillum aliphaticivorans]|uniref:Uncharacterized protein n=1 Tax=Desulfatibacillum aliphaticivorans TaxID=218208 RepID=B8FIR9_DESAL|nr:hypothetical protein [Desulfatibacillum aliphaticivorans]ACL04310.1 hypothetical protein Dalk_2617 [Desulfatibacillum aliphaticivorans]
MGTLMWIIVIGCAAWVYFDSTKNKIGKTSEEKTLTNAQPWMWALGTLGIWIIAFPLYLFKRKELVQKAQENPVDVPGKQKKVVFGLLGAALVVVLFSGLFGDSNLISMVKKGQLNDYPGVTIGHLINKSLDDAEWKEQEGEGGVGYVTATGVYEDKGEDILISLKFKVLEKTNMVQPIVVYLDGDAMPPYVLSQLFERMYSRHGPESRGGVSIPDANLVAQADLQNAQVCAYTYFSENPEGTLTMKSMEKEGLKLTEGVKVKIVNASPDEFKLRAYHEYGDKVFEVDADGNYSINPK